MPQIDLSILNGATDWWRNTVGNDATYAASFLTPNGWYTYVPESVINQGLEKDGNTYWFPYFQNQGNLNAFLGQASKVDLSGVKAFDALSSYYGGVNTLGDWLKSKGVSSTGYLIPGESSLMDSEVRVAPTAQIGSIKGLGKDSSGNLVYATSGGSGNQYIGSDNVIHDTETKRGSWWQKNLGSVATIVGIGLQFIPGIGTAIGYAVLGAGDAIAGAALAGEIAAATGVSTINALSVASAAGAASIAASTAAMQGGDGADIVRAAATAGAASITNVAAGGGIVGAGAGSAVGTALAGGNLDQVTLNVLAATTGAAVNQQLGPAAGAIATDLVKTGGVSDVTLIKAALGEANVEGTSKSGAAKIESLYDRLIAPPVKPGSEPFTIGNATYQELEDGSAKVTRGSNVRIMSPDNFADVKEQQLQNMVSAPVVDSSQTLPPVEVTAPDVPNIEPVVTDFADNTAAESDGSGKLERITVVGKREDSNTSPVVTGLDTVTITGNRDPELDRVTVTGGEGEEEKPKEEEKTPPDELYPTITSFSKRKTTPSKKPTTITGAGASTITGASPARLLADSLAAYRPATGAIESEESGKERQNVWNEKSLRLKDALGL